MPGSRNGRLWRSQLLARDAAWKAAPFPLTEGIHAISAMILAGDVLYAASSRVSLAVLDTKDGHVVSRLEIPPPAWDGLAAAEGRLLLSTQDGRVVCLGEGVR